MSYERMIYDSVKYHMSIIGIGDSRPRDLHQADVNKFLWEGISTLMARLDELEKQSVQPISDDETGGVYK